MQQLPESDLELISQLVGDAPLPEEHRRAADDLAAVLALLDDEAEGVLVHHLIELHLAAVPEGEARLRAKWHVATRLRRLAELREASYNDEYVDGNEWSLLRCEAVDHLARRHRAALGEEEVWDAGTCRVDYAVRFGVCTAPECRSTPVEDADYCAAHGGRAGTRNPMRDFYDEAATHELPVGDTVRST